ncbi:hypothetical protein A3D84_00030 [Candidatus Woesebacteria bacterium RIFCSPHIGHO2_02_FULL_42_20]|uniref:Uncharacterized protein n=1 Tax=Candidatus Woesebacteria bacterium RIFCSPHIGHO2_12_FULL_41_24 TaxID=1802510 RepID=A0A1F8ATJ3_9BACT|nr:MAG: hypothetical protein A2W15_01530 [Candidatus Woesebacteria bacterium RBG_16_41_13]OGM30813.1 MAG: hypothetical protein A2873_04115 [Candidatus Woesebacteria bacterium RIFCSPHIGHO2_01_FULL_42_80]OGM34268.1 MAG: hypothetical protein A3D84_00030 [Candidatus Woesebacteria bacterium RIFCSPHIGHO2_02_FULL_42_20]OGM55063.1 MAG: hypothetical protein A3E44_04040 [Candidatus Woesebacteria bacterium RIFCSPHIGHO2_12_FULL_41_24]OGM65853.1 MAG: hypothetical protein A2969_01155 [Candidatus Woesebacteri
MSEADEDILKETRAIVDPATILTEEEFNLSVEIGPKHGVYFKKIADPEQTVEVDQREWKESATASYEIPDKRDICPPPGHVGAEISIRHTNPDDNNQRMIEFYKELHDRQGIPDARQTG